MSSDPEHDLMSAGQPAAPRGVLPAFIDRSLARAQLKFRRLGREITILGKRLELDVFPDLDSPDEDRCRVVFDRTEHGSEVSVRVGHHEYVLGPYDILTAFLDRLGIRALMLDTNLEYNQIVDVIETLWSVRCVLDGACPSVLSRLLRRKRVAEAFTEPEGLHVACTETRLVPEEGVLDISNSYCPLVFSRAVNAYMHRFREFRDHRAFFFSAPKYALFVTIMVLVPLLAANMTQHHLAATIASLLVAALLGIGTLIVLQTIGAVEYDKEHQTHELQARHRALTTAHHDIQRDLERARRIQRMLLPPDDAQPMPEHCEMAYWFRPEMAVGGDYYDVRAFEDGRLAILLADVAGHGMSGAFVTGLIKTAFALGYDSDTTPEAFMGLVNGFLARMTPEDSFAAMVFVVYDGPGRMLQYVVAGHAPVPVVVRKDGVLLELGASGGMIAGVQDDTAYQRAEMRMEEGDLLVLSTDGIPDAADIEGEFFGMERLRTVLRNGAGMTAKELVSAVSDAVLDYTGDKAQTDDQTLIVMSVR